MFLSITRPIANFQDLTFGKWKVLTQQKEVLYEENMGLKERIRELESFNFIQSKLEKENNELKSLLGMLEPVLQGEDKYVVSSVLVRPPRSPYDIFVIDAGKQKGVEVGMPVTAYGNIMIGYVEEVFSKTSKVKLVSFAGEETESWVDSANVSAVSVGRGGGSFEIILPRAIEVLAGDNVLSMDKSLLMGIVDVIESDLADPFQKIIFRLPINIQELRYVMVHL